MDVHREDHHILLRLYRGEDLLRTFHGWAAEERLPHARVSGIGALEDLTLGWFDLRSKTYRRRELDGSWELLNLAGNLGWAEDAPFLHAHVVVGGPEMQTLGGHLFGGVVSVTAELFVVPGAHRLVRDPDPITGLKLWRLGGRTMDPPPPSSLS